MQFTQDSVSFMQLTQTPLVSIIVPIFNVAPYLQQCLESILKQSYTNLDIILVDDGSSDESLDIALKFAKQDERIFVVSKPNGGQATARNFGLEFIKGSALRGFCQGRNDEKNFPSAMEGEVEESKSAKEWEITSLKSRNDTKIQSFTQTHSFDKAYKIITAQEINAHFTQIAPNFVKSDLERINDFITQELSPNALIHFVDSDDMITSDCIEICVQNLLSKDLDIAVHNLQEFDENTKEFKNSSYLSNLKQNDYNTGLELLSDNKIYDFYFAWQGLFRAKILNRYGLRYTEGIYHEDHDFGTLLFCLAGKVDYIDAPLYIYRARSGSITNNQKQAAFPAQIPSFLEPLRGDFSDYKSLRAYFRAFCFVRVGFNIWRFYESSLAQAQNSEFKMRYGRFFTNVVLGYAMNICKIPLRNDPLGIKATLGKIRFQRRFVWRHYFKDLHRQPKKLAHIANLKYFG